MNNEQWNALQTETLDSLSDLLEEIAGMDRNAYASHAGRVIARATTDLAHLYALAEAGRHVDSLTRTQS